MNTRDCNLFGLGLLKGPELFDNALEWYTTQCFPNYDTRVYPNMWYELCRNEIIDVPLSRYIHDLSSKQVLYIRDKLNSFESCYRINCGFDKSQIIEIYAGSALNIPISLYDNRNINAWQMRGIRLFLEDIYTKPSYFKNIKLPPIIIN